MAAGLLQVFQASVPLDLFRAADPELQAFYQGPSVVRVEGLFAHWFGVAEAEDSAAIVFVSGWESDAAILEFARANRLPPRTGPIAEIVALGTTERWELIDQVVSTFEPGEASVLRLIRARVPPGQLGAVIDGLAAARGPLSSRRDITVSQVASRRVGDASELLVLVAWRDAMALAGMLGRVGRWWERLAADHGLEGVTEATFALRPSGLLRLTPRGPAVVVTDDRGVIVDATPAAVGMLGRSVWDLFQIRFDDLPRLLGDGTALIARPEGGSVHVHLVRADNMPAPGRHAALLIPAFDPRPPDGAIPAAIAAAYRRGPLDPIPPPEPGPGPEVPTIVPRDLPLAETVGLRHSPSVAAPSPASATTDAASPQEPAPDPALATMPTVSPA